MRPKVLLSTFMTLVFTSPTHSQDTLGVAKGYTTLSTPNFALKLVSQSQTLASLRPSSSTFDYLPFDLLSKRARDGQYQLGDITLRYRRGKSGAWISADSAAKRAAIVPLKNSSAGILASADLSPTLPTVDGTVLNITRQWGEMAGDLTMSVTLTNAGSSVVEIGALGFPIAINNIFTSRTAEKTRALCSLADPYIGLDAGYVQVTPLSGSDPALVVTPLAGTGLEAWRNLAETSYSDTQYGTQTFEAVYEWQTLTKAYTDNEWKSVQPWNLARSRELQPGEKVEFGLRFTVAPDGPQGIEKAVRSTGSPTVVGVPGYVVPKDMTARLVVSSNSTVSSMTFDPAGAFAVVKEKDDVYALTPTPDAWGRTRLTIKHVDGRTQTVHYYITKAGPDVLSDAGNFTLTKQWFTDANDPFNRAPSIITWDREKDAAVTQEGRVWIAGLSDEAGAGSYLVAALKQYAQPSAQEVAKLEQFASKILRTVVQNPDYTVRKSIFYHDKTAQPNYPYASGTDWTSWTSWNKTQAYQTDRAYDYVHPVAAYWSLYRVGRAYPDLLKTNTADWYLDQAVKTISKMMGTDTAGGAPVQYAMLGLMEETVFGEILKDLYREGRNDQAKTLEGSMNKRAKAWDARAVPFGSEMAWDSTAQEGVYYWSKYFNLAATRQKTISSIIAYMPTVPHWGWNGNARRYWDNKYGGKIARVERQLHHYGSALNALPLLSEFRSRSSSAASSNLNLSYLVRVAFAGILAPLSNIDHEGFGSASFHSYPDTMKWEPYSGDYGPGFLGMMLGSACYVVDSLGSDAQISSLASPLVFGGQITAAESSDGAAQTAITVVPRDSVRRRVFVSSFGAMVEVDAGTIQRIVWDKALGDLRIVLGQITNGPLAKAAVVWIDDDKKGSAGGPGDFTVTAAGVTNVDRARGGWSVPLDQSKASLIIVKRISTK